jgi:hypothetical protein
VAIVLVKDVYFLVVDDGKEMKVFLIARLRIGLYNNMQLLTPSPVAEQVKSAQWLSGAQKQLGAIPRRRASWHMQDLPTLRALRNFG